MVSNTIIEVDEVKTLFQLIFLKDDAYQSVEVDEVTKIDFHIIRQHLEQGESVFITGKSKQPNHPEKTHLVAS